MKKNLRIASAAAAALLAVAPVAASTVSTVLADTNVTVNGSTANAGKEATVNFTVKDAYKLAEGASASDLQAALVNTALPTGANIITSKANVYKATDVTDGRANDSATITQDTTKAISKLKASDGDYVAVADVTITGLSSGETYKITTNEKTFSLKATSTGTITFSVVSNKFSIADAAKLGAPYLKDKTVGKAVSAGSVTLESNEYNVDGVVSAIQKAYDVDITDNSDNKATASFTNLKQDVRDALKAAGVTTTGSSESFTKPAAAFNVTINMNSSNGKTSTAVVTVNPNSDLADSTFPRIKYFVKGDSAATQITIPTANKKPASASLDNIDNLVDSNNSEFNFNYVPVNGVVDTAAIKKAFSAQVSEKNTTVLDVNVDASKVNTKVAGKYPVVVSATNADKKTTKVTFMLTVGVKGATYKTVQSDGDVPVYKIDGNNVTDTKTVVKNGDQIAVFGDTIKVGDKTYARINSADSDLYVESKYVDGTFKPADKVAKKVMHNAFIYDKDHKRVGTKTLAAYSNVDVYGAATKLADGSLVYQIGDNQYVMADNIDGTVRTLTHNAYVYKTSTKRADRRVLRKGAKVTTYGTPYKFKNGVSYYRIGGPAKQYVKVANF